MFKIWVIDDDAEFCRDVIEFWEKLSANYPFEFRYFPTARTALTTLWSLPLSRQSMPQAIIVDGHLDRDDKELNNGVAVLREIIAVADGKPPLLIGWSADPFAEEDMKSAGADATFGKTQPREVIHYLQDKYRELHR